MDKRTHSPNACAPEARSPEISGVLIPKAQHLRREQRRDGGYNMVPAYTFDEVVSLILKEREECAQIAEMHSRREDDIGAIIARAIRSPQLR